MADGRVAATLLQALDGVPRSRAELLARSGVCEGDWPGAVQSLLARGLARRTGTKKWARYTLGGACQSALLPPPVSTTVTLDCGGDEDGALLELELAGLGFGRGGAHPARASTDPALARGRAALTKAPAPPRAAGNSDWPPGAAEVLAAMGNLPMARGDLIDRARIPGHLWVNAIQSLVSAGVVRRTGTKRGTRYVRIASLRSAAPLDAAPARSPQPEPAGSDAARGDLAGELRARGVVSLVDLRSKGGCLWVIDGPEARVAVAALGQERAVRFQFKAPGPRCTDYAPAWWTVAR